MNVELLIYSNDDKKTYIPIVEEGIDLSLERRSAPGKLEFKVIKDKIIGFSEGAPVRLKVDGKPVFFGWVFSKKRDKDQIITVTAYDQIRYLQNKDTYVYENKTASQFIKQLAGDFNLQTGNIEDTGYIIPSRVEEDTALLDMIENALDLTLENKKEMYVLYDDFGKLALKNIANMKIGNEKKSTYLMFDDETAENFEYESSINQDVYNKIKLTYDNEETGVREVYIAQDSSNINKWGILQYFETLQKNENGAAKANALLSLYNQKTRNLKITHAIGDTRVRAGSIVVINLKLGDINIKNFMLVEKVKHTFKLNEHYMDLTLRGGEFIA